MKAERHFYRFCAIAFTLCIGILVGMEIVHNHAHSFQPYSADLEYGDWDRPESPIRNYYAAKREFDLEAMYRTLESEPEMPNDTSGAPEYWRKKAESLTTMVVKSQIKVSDTEVALEVLPLGNGWSQEFPDQITVVKTDDGWRIRSLREYGPRHGGHGLQPAQEASGTSIAGEWVNTDKATGEITRIEINVENNTYTVRAWGACSPFDCFWGAVQADVPELGANRIKAEYVKSHGETVIDISLTDDTHIECQLRTVYTDRSDGAVHTSTLTFERDI